ncbi:hypothetical protein D1AOALGA4SA_474 [Olavius algarvensis Delta 1 endosymbiont]|nr:hypothetical protein D1AOALGA4SA_474 [Olavius algarvensis Delta 1 endosymbiont]
MSLFQKVIADCIGNDIHVCLKNNAPTGAVLLTYCAMDAMAFLSMPAGKQKVGRSDFKNWVEKYMKTGTDQPYNYDKEDLYGARCGIVHTYGAESDLSRSNKCRKLVYKPNCLDHFYDPVKHPDLVVLGINLFIRDFYDAVDKFLHDIENDISLRKLVEERLPKLFHIKKGPNKANAADAKSRAAD